MSVPHPSAAQFKLAAASFRRSQAFRGDFCFFVANFIQPQNSTLKIGNPKRKLIFQPSFFRGYVKLRGCRAPIWGRPCYTVIARILGVPFSCLGQHGELMGIPWPYAKNKSQMVVHICWSMKLRKKNKVFFRGKMFETSFQVEDYEQRNTPPPPKRSYDLHVFLAEIREMTNGPLQFRYLNAPLIWTTKKRVEQERNTHLTSPL